MKVTDASTYRLLRTDLNRNETALQELQFQGTSGLKLNKASDDPTLLQPVLGARNQITLAERYITTMGTASDQMESTDGFLGSIENIMQRVDEISISGVNAALSQTDLDTYANEVAELRDQLFSTANSQIDGKYIFAGYSVKDAPFVENPSYDPATYDESDMSTWPVQYQGDSNRLQLEVDEGQHLDTTITGNELFSGISNEDYANGVRGLTGQKLTSAPLTPSTAGDIVIENGAVTTTLAAASLADTDDNYAAKLAGMLNGSAPPNDTGLRTSITPATRDLGSAPTGGYTQFDLTVNSEGGTAVTINLTNPVSDDDIRSALGSALSPPDAAATSGTFANGVSFDTQGGSLRITGPDNGADLEMTLKTDNTATPPVTSTTYGQVTTAPDSTSAVTLSGAGLAATGITNSDPTTLAGSTNLDIFGVLANLEAALRAGNVSDPNGVGGGIQGSKEKIEMAADQTRLQRSQLGVRAKRVEGMKTQQEGALVDLQATLSRYQDADIVEVLSKMVQRETALRANLEIIGRVSSITILDYM